MSALLKMCAQLDSDDFFDLDSDFGNSIISSAIKQLDIKCIKHLIDIHAFDINFTKAPTAAFFHKDEFQKYSLIGILGECCESDIFSSDPNNNIEYEDSIAFEHRSFITDPKAKVIFDLIYDDYLANLLAFNSEDGDFSEYNTNSIAATFFIFSSVACMMNDVDLLKKTFKDCKKYCDLDDDYQLFDEDSILENQSFISAQILPPDKLIVKEYMHLMLIASKFGSTDCMAAIIDEGYDLFKGNALIVMDHNSNEKIYDVSTAKDIEKFSFGDLLKNIYELKYISEASFIDISSSMLGLICNYKIPNKSIGISLSNLKNITYKIIDGTEGGVLYKEHVSAACESGLFKVKDQSSRMKDELGFLGTVYYREIFDDVMKRISSSNGSSPEHMKHYFEVIFNSVVTGEEEIFNDLNYVIDYFQENGLKPEDFQSILFGNKNDNLVKFIARNGLTSQLVNLQQAGVPLKGPDGTTSSLIDVAPDESEIADVIRSFQAREKTNELLSELVLQPQKERPPI